MQIESSAFCKCVEIYMKMQMNKLYVEVFLLGEKMKRRNKLSKNCKRNEGKTKNEIRSPQIAYIYIYFLNIMKRNV